jgi:hypothetical protein
MVKDLDKINLDSTNDIDSLLEEVEKMTRNDNYEKTIQFNYDLSNDFIKR